VEEERHPQVQPKKRKIIKSFPLSDKYSASPLFRPRHTVHSATNAAIVLFLFTREAPSSDSF
jgi:hypothetical protein